MKVTLLLSLMLALVMGTNGQRKTARSVALTALTNQTEPVRNEREASPKYAAFLYAVGCGCMSSGVSQSTVACIGSTCQGPYPGAGFSLWSTSSLLTVSCSCPSTVSYKKRAISMAYTSNKVRLYKDSSGTGRTLFVSTSALGSFYP